MQRNTRQRWAIRQVLMKARRPLTHDEILKHGQKLAPSLGIATVYRNVKALVEEGWASAVEFPGRVPRYELADQPPHHHFLCNSCDQAFDIPRSPDEVEALAPKGFLVESHELTLMGRCATCA